MTLQTFTTSPYTQEHFKDFIQQAFPQAQLLNSPTTPYKDGHIIHAYAPICQDIELESSHILQVFAFEVGSTHAKVTLHKELAKIAKNNASHILACFYDPSDTQEFRLSLITTGFDFEANKTTHSNLRRQSFVLGDSIPTHTAQKQLQTLIDSQAKSKQALEEAFSLQAVTDEFYAEYKKLYDDLCQVLNASQAAINALNGYQGLSGEKATSTFVKKLLGRIIFLYFLQKKGWLGVEQGKQWGSGDRHFFRSLFTRAKAQGDSFYTKLLCPLFFESLNTERKDDYSQELGCKIPFLNGGLFEEAKLPATEHHSFDRHIAIEQALDNTQFAKIFDLFDRYHFTIEESTPDNVEISIDPEMLGKVFENLIDYNKDTGAFYTRRPIVHFMCKNALTRYLQIQLLGSIAQADLSASTKVDSGLESTFDKTAQNASDSHDTKAENVFDKTAVGGRIFDEKAGLCSGEQGDKTRVSIDAASHKLPAFSQKANAQTQKPETSQAIQSFIFHQEITPYIKQHKEKILTLLQECTILDNAIGSGAFPMGLLLEILEAIRTLCPELKEEQLAAHKRQIIANQIYGVDIDGDAIEIAKLRFWLSIAVDESSPSPLPNLDFKLMQGNSLLESICTIPVIESLEQEERDGLFEKRETHRVQSLPLFSHDQAKDLTKLFLDYYESHTQEKKQDIKQKILKIMQDVFTQRKADIDQEIHSLINDPKAKASPKAQAQAKAQSLALENFKAELDSLLQDYARHDFHTDKLFLYRFFFAPVFAKGGFDIVIGNPPYIRQEKIPQKQEILQEFEALRLEPQAPIKFSDSSADIFTYFYAKGLELLKPSGVLSFITSNKWCRAKYGQNLRELLLPRLDSHYDFNGIKAFESATVDTAITTALKSQPQKSKESSHNLYFLALGQSGASHQALLSNSPYLSTTIHTKRTALPASSLSASSLSFASPAALALKAKIEAIGTPLKEWDISIYRGILTGYNEAFIIDSNKRDEILRNCDDTQASLKPYPSLQESNSSSSLRGSEATEAIHKNKDSNNKVDCHDSATAESRNDKGKLMLTERQRTSELIKPILRGRDIKRYSYEWAGLWIIGTFPALKLNIDDYPALRNYLESYRPRIDQSGEKGCRKKTSNKWFETQDNIAYYQEFEKEKIVWNPVSGEYFFTHIKETMYFNNSLFMMTDSADNAISPSLRGSGDSHNEAIHKNKVDSSSKVDCHADLQSARNDKLLYILGLMNSTLYKWLITQMTNLVETGKYAYGAKDKIEKLPIPKVDSKTEAEFIQIVQEIVESKKQGRDTKELESTLDTMVCKLYNLSQAEAESVLSLSLSLSSFIISCCLAEQSAQSCKLCA